jgi:2,5-diketo-D-gluconate reductase A
MTIPHYTLNDGLEIPALGFGTYKLTENDGYESIATAIAAGYRLLDTAALYGNEAEVGRAIAESGIDRDQFIVTTKLRGRALGFDETMLAFEESRQLLGLDVVDIYLIHWPNPRLNRYLDSWQAMIELKDDGLIRSIGVCNFPQQHLQKLMDSTGVTPSINQIELHPYFPQAELRAFHAEHGIQTESWSPLGRGSELLSEQVIVDAASAHGVSPAQAVLRWHTQQGLLPLPKSASAERQALNLDSFGFDLTQIELEAITALERGRLGGLDPETTEIM